MFKLRKRVHCRSRGFTLIELLACQGVALRAKRSRAFTLIELLVVISIIGILASMLLPSLMRAKYVAKMSIDLSNHKQNAAAAIIYAGDNDEYYPTSYDINYHQSIFSVKNKTSAGPMAYDYVTLMEPYYGDGVGKLWACPLATVDPAPGTGSHHDEGGWNKGAKSVSSNSSLFISYAFYFGRRATSCTAHGGAHPNSGSGGTGGHHAPGGHWTFSSNIPDGDGMLKVGQPLKLKTVYLGTGGTWQNSGGFEFNVLTSDVYIRFHSNEVWFYHHQTYNGGMEAKQGKANDNQSWQWIYGMLKSNDFANKAPGLAYWDYTYTLDDGSGHILPRVTGSDSRFTRDGLPHPDEL